MIYLFYFILFGYVKVHTYFLIVFLYIFHHDTSFKSSFISFHFSSISASEKSFYCKYK